MIRGKKLTLVVFLAAVLLLLASMGCKHEPEEESDKKAEDKKTMSAQKDKSTEQGKTEDSTQQAEEPKVRMVNLYFADENAEYLLAERKEVFDSSNLKENTLEELLKGPTEEGHIATIPEGTEIKGISIGGDTIVLNFSREFVDNHPGGSAFELMTVYSIVNTVTEVSGVRKVKFLVEGKEVESLAGHMDLTQSIERDESLIKE